MQPRNEPINPPDPMSPTLPPDTGLLTLAELFERADGLKERIAELTNHKQVDG